MANDYQSHKRNLILNMINHLGPISRTELIALTDYRPASVGAIIKSMIEEGLVVETGYSSCVISRNIINIFYHRLFGRRSPIQIPSTSSHLRIFYFTYIYYINNRHIV